MRPSVRIALVVVGLAVAVYGVASLNGGWLGEPPWWWTETSTTDVTVFGRTQSLGLEELRDGREWISSGVVAAGLILVAFGAWPRRRRTTATT